MIGEDRNCRPESTDGPWLEGRRRMIPRVPVLSGGSLLGRHRADIPSILDAGAARALPAGRMAIVHALRAAGVAAGDAILVPAYHCQAMIGPILWVGAVPVFYRLRSDLSADLDHIRARLTPKVRALMIVHYFGFPQDMPALRRLSDEHGLTLIEDCAHAFFGCFAGKAVGWYGDYAIASTMKFFPVYDGGCLVSSRHPLDGIALRPAGWRAGAKAAVNIVERALEFGRLGAAAPLLRPTLAMKDAVWARAKVRVAAAHQTIRPAATEAAEMSDGNDATIESAWLDRTASLPSRMVMAAASRARIVARRRGNFIRMLAALGDLPGCRPLFDDLPQGVVPWVFPMVFDDVDSAHNALDRQGIPIPHFGKHLWSGLDVSLCPVSADLSRRCLQLPCHQELTDNELGWLIERVVEALSARPQHPVAAR